MSKCQQPATTFPFTSYAASTAKALDAIGADGLFAAQSRILIKPNLVNASPFPVTTSPDFCAAVIAYIRSHSTAEIVIAEGCGDNILDTADIYRKLGYHLLSERYHVPLIDLNEAPLTKMTRKACSFFPVMYLPEIAFSHFIVSLPVLKAHSLAEITGTLKNMMGFAPPKYYAGKHGIWKKAAFHENIHQAIHDLNRYRTPDLSLIDASVGLRDYHLGGARCSPPLKKLIAGIDPVAVDRCAAQLLGQDYHKIPHLMMADEAPYTR